MYYCRVIPFLNIRWFSLPTCVEWDPTWKQATVKRVWVELGIREISQCYIFKLYALQNLQHAPRRQNMSRGSYPPGMWSEGHTWRKLARRSSGLGLGSKLRSTAFCLTTQHRVWNFWATSSTLGQLSSAHVVVIWGFSFAFELTMKSLDSAPDPRRPTLFFRCFPVFFIIFDQKTLGAEVPKLTHRSCSTSRVCKKSWWGRLTFAWWGGLKSLGCFGPCIQSCCPDLMLEILLSRVYCTAVSQGSV